MTIKTTLLMISLVTAVPAATMATPSKAASGKRVQSAEKKESATRSTDDDPLGDWLEKNGSRFGLFVEGQKAAPKAVPKLAPSSKSGTSAKMPVNASVNANDSTVVNSNLIKKVSTTGIDVLGDTHQATQEPDPIAKFAAELPTGASGEPYVEKKVFTPPPAALQSTDAAAQIAAVMTDLDFSSKCEKFASENGFGVWGRTIVDELVRGNGNSLLQGTDDLRRACPNYDYLGVREKSYVWVKIIASMSFLESSCDAQAGITRAVHGPNGRAVGLLQLHQNKEGNYAENCNHRDSMNPIKTLRCGISMLDRQIEKTSALFSRASYWGVLRPQGDVVKTKRGKKRVVLARTVVGGLKELPFCQRK